MRDCIGFALLHSMIGKKLTPISQPIRFKTKTNHDLVTRVFPRFGQFDWIYFESSLVPGGIFLFFWMAVGQMWFWIYDTKSKCTLIGLQEHFYRVSKVLRWSIGFQGSTSLCRKSGKLAAPCQPIRCKIKTITAQSYASDFFLAPLWCFLFVPVVHCDLFGFGSSTKPKNAHSCLNLSLTLFRYRKSDIWLTDGIFRQQMNLISVEILQESVIHRIAELCDFYHATNTTKTLLSHSKFASFKNISTAFRKNKNCF